MNLEEEWNLSNNTVASLVETQGRTRAVDVDTETTVFVDQDHGQHDGAHHRLDASVSSYHGSVPIWLTPRLNAQSIASIFRTKAAYNTWSWDCNDVVDVGVASTTTWWGEEQDPSCPVFLGRDDYGSDSGRDDDDDGAEDSSFAWFSHEGINPPPPSSSSPPPPPQAVSMTSGGASSSTCKAPLPPNSQPTFTSSKANGGYDAIYPEKEPSKCGTSRHRRDDSNFSAVTLSSVTFSEPAFHTVERHMSMGSFSSSFSSHSNGDNDDDTMEHTTEFVFSPAVCGGCLRPHHHPAYHQQQQQQQHQGREGSITLDPPFTLLLQSPTHPTPASYWSPVSHLEAAPADEDLEPLPLQGDGAVMYDVDVDDDDDYHHVGNNGPNDDDRNEPESRAATTTAAESAESPSSFPQASVQARIQLLDGMKRPRHSSSNDKDDPDPERDTDYGNNHKRCCDTFSNNDTLRASLALHSTVAVEPSMTTPPRTSTCGAMLGGD